MPSTRRSSPVCRRCGIGALGTSTGSLRPGRWKPGRGAQASRSSTGRMATTIRSSRRQRRQLRARSAFDRRVVVHDAEDLAAVVAVAGQSLVAVDAVVVMTAAVHQSAHVALAAAVPGAVDIGLEAVAMPHVLA